FLEQLSTLGERSRRRAWQDRRKLVAQGQQTRGLEPDDRRAGRDMRTESVQHASCLVPRLVDKTGREKGPATAEGPAIRRVRGDDAIAGARQPPLGGTGIFRLEIAVEGIDQQDAPLPSSRRCPTVGTRCPFR